MSKTLTNGEKDNPNSGNKTKLKLASYQLQLKQFLSVNVSLKEHGK